MKMQQLESEIKQLIIDSLNLEGMQSKDIDSSAALFGDGLGLDSIDALELGMAVQKKYQIKIKAQDEEIKKHFYSVYTLAGYIEACQRGD